MAFWRRARSEQAQQPDPELDFLTQHQGARLRELAREAFAEAGVEVLPHAQHLEASDGRQFGLWNLAATCAQAPGGEADWPEIVREHVAGAIRSLEAPPLTDLPEHEILAGVFLRVMGTATLPPQWREWYSYARPVAGDLVEVLALDLPESVTVLRDEDVDRVGEDRLREAGLRNLLAEPIQSYEVAGEPGSGALHIVEGDSYFTASKLIIFREVLEATWGQGDLSHGVVVAAPIRHMLLFHPIEGIDVLDGVQRMTGLAASLFGDAPGGVSPFVYWWRDGELTQLSGYDDEGRLQVMVGDELTRVLEELAARS